MRVAILLGMVLVVCSPAMAGRRDKSCRMVDSSEFTTVPYVAGQEQYELARFRDGRTPTGIFGRRPRGPKNPSPSPDNPNAPKVPTEPPDFEWPGDPVEGAEDVIFEDWTPEDFKQFFDVLISLITAIVGMFSGFQVSKRELPA